MSGRYRPPNAPPPTASSRISRRARPRLSARSPRPPQNSTPPADVKLKDPKDWKLAGKGLKRLDTPDKVIGKTVYGIDVKLPGMLNAAIKDCPVTGGKLKSYDEAKIAGMKGVKKVVKVGDTAVAVVADTFWHAKTALDALPIVWDEGENAKVSSASIAKWLSEGLEGGPAYVGNSNGDVNDSARRRGEEGRGGLQLSLPEPRHHGADERHRALYTRTNAKCGAARRMAKPPLRRCWKAPSCPPTNATCTS